ncbi:glycosyltransferase [Pedobacter sp. BMA]|uniref:glycosyltransferase n=1 Tax=Pedobacter sp. BMA TaxID=1663685 RepID=UPI0006496B89|nr:glycosyltransferase [Pedobacter sp. BMA]KLT63767.1 galactosyltransferase [Pedobacter sp. BMA]
MKIGIISHLKHPIRAPFAGGLEVFTHHITTALQSSGHDVTLFASSSSDPSLPLVPILTDDHYDELTGQRRKMKDLPSEYIAEHHAYFRLMTEIDQYGFDVIFNNSLHYVPITMATIVNTPIVTVLHTPPFYELELAIAAERRKPIIDYITVSRKSAENWRGLVNQCNVILNGIKIEKWDFHPEAGLDRYALWFGRIHPDKGLHLAIAAARAAKIPLRIAGGIADEKYYKQKIEPLMGDDLVFLGLLDQPSLNREIGNASVCLITPCWEEPFGFVAAEAMACGTPIAGFRMGALPEIIAPHTGVLAAGGNVDQLAEAILEAEKLNRSEIRKYALQKFSFVTMIAAYEEQLESTANKNNKLINTI